MPNRDSVQTCKEFAGPLTLIGLSLFGVILVLPTNALGQKQRASQQIPNAVLLRIVRAEDERRWDRDLGVLLSDKDPAVRKRAALAAGRIGNPLAVQMLIPLLDKDPDRGVTAMAAFALGEIESGDAIKALEAQIDIDTLATVRARAVEALGKIAAALPKTEEAQAKAAGAAIMRALEIEAGRRSLPEFEVIELGITAALRARPEGAGELIARFLRYPDPIPAIAANALARLRAKDGNAELLKLVAGAKDPELRANAARVLGTTEDKEALSLLVDRAFRDEDPRVRVSAMRALAGYKDRATALPYFEDFLKDAHCQRQLLQEKKLLYHRRDSAECLESVTALGRMFQGTGKSEVVQKLSFWEWDFPVPTPEMEIALARIDPADYLKQRERGTGFINWRTISSIAQGLGEIAALPESSKDKAALSKRAVELVREMLDSSNSSSKEDRVVHSEYAIPDLLRAFAAFKPSDLAEVLRKHLLASDVVVRATAAELLGELPPDPVNANALTKAFAQAAKDKLNDAQLALLEALGKQKTPGSNEILKSALYSPDHLLRIRAAGYLKANGVSDFSSSTSIVATGKSNEDYQRAIARMGKDVRARVVTSRGAFTVELLPDDAPLNVDNFIKLARSGYFRGITFHRVVPNFVVQGGDPRGDGNGGPGYSVRCEINEVPYGRGAVGMALSGKDTGGSQWFVTHSPQPHLDGGYTVFGRVVSGMEVVDEIVRGDVIRSVSITETSKKRQAVAASPE